MISTVIIEDIPANRELLRTYLEDLSEIRLVGEAEDVESGIRLIQRTNPKLVLLDIDLPDGSGFDIIKAIPKPGFKTIVTTGYNQFAIQAIKLSAIDYLLKPIQKEDLFEAIGNTSRIIHDEQYQHDLLRHYMNANNKVDRLVISSDKYKTPIMFSDIMYLKSDGGYTFFYLSNGESTLSSRSIHYYEEFLPKDQFFRTHKSFIINYSFIKVIPIGRSGAIPMPNGKDVQISVRRMAAFRKWYRQHTEPAYPHP